MKKWMVLGAVLLAGSAHADVNAQLKFNLNTTPPSALAKIEVLQNAAIFDVTALWSFCIVPTTDLCAVVTQPLVVGPYNYQVRITDTFGRQAVSNTVLLSVPNPPAPTAHSVSVVLTTGTPTPNPTQTPTP